MLSLLSFMHHDKIADIISRWMVNLPEKGDVARLKQLLNFPVDVNWIPELSVVDAMSTRVDTVVETPVIRLTDSSLRGGKHALKRLTDVVASSLLIVLLAPVMAVIALMVKRSSPGPVLFKQKRRGIDGATIKVWKFRTMWQHPEGDQARQAVENDDRVTPLGAVLRRWSLDELPQLFNVLQGKMSLVGPRPHALWMDDQFEDEIDLYRQRHKVKPGITGWAQIHGFRGGTETLDKMEARVKHDLYYINHWSLWLDVKILLKTLPAILSKQNAY